ncbi:radical SAM protein [Halopseudomonas salegens]|uniref:Oxygen-independent coproporphyrinogen III oxidase n=1 Tax=Halopseudomonas salegens TaxID=1434072 RepID=A0A1H2FVD0_9GAMM|nr:radical SAM protein [Halopseudomonas salegens]SDU11289.1 oxygen-independent coproporphyrinogen-3 oxidase [Halopseudomonas salegens]
MQAVLYAPTSTKPGGNGQLPLRQLLRETVDHLAIRRALRASRLAERDLALNIRLPFCANACFFCNRCRIIAKDRSKASDYLHLLGTEIATIGRHLDQRQQVRQLHLGGGTPTFFGHQALTQLMNKLHRHFNLSAMPDIDASVAIDPREVDWATLDLLRGLGFNRLNIMQPSLDPRVQTAVNRLQGDQQFAECLAAARTLRFHSIGIELMAGLPEQSLDSFCQTLDSIVGWRPERIRLTCYRHQPEHYPPQRRINRASLPSPQETAAAKQHCQQYLLATGYQRLQHDLFVLPQDPLAIAAEDSTPLRHTACGLSGHPDCDEIGVGLGAISDVNGLAWQNSTQLACWQQRAARAQFTAQYQWPAPAAP